jgi:hypothetical protein
MMRKFTLCIALLLPFVYIYSQDLDYYYLEIKEGHELGEIQKTVNTDQTLTLSMQNTVLATVINEKPIYAFEKAFPSAQTPRLQRVYLISAQKNVSLQFLKQRGEVNNVINLFEDEDILASSPNLSFGLLPNDYDDIITGGRNTALDLIRAPLAWTITTGHSSVLAGVADTNINLGHEDLIGKFVDNIIINQNTFPHGIAVSGQIAAETNNNKGIAVIGGDTKLVFATAYHDVSLTLARIALINGLLQLSQYPGVRVINCSWVISPNSPQKPFLDDVMDEVNQNGVLVVGAAGNNNNGVPYYPGAYDEALSVTSVGHRVAPTYYHNIFDAGGNYFWARSWKDIHEFRPDTPETNSHNHNDKVDVTAPGQINISLTDIYNDFPSGYRLTVATSQTAPIVTGIAALVFAANPNLTAAQVKDIIKSTADDIYYIPYNQPYVGLLGTGRVNAFRAVLKAKCMDDPNYAPNLDLMVRNSMLDYGYEPDVNTGNVMWNSQEIWVRHNSGESYIDVHQNPEYDPGNPNYVNVRVTNRSCVTSSGNEELTLYWAKASTSLNWPHNWDGSLTMGDITGTNSQAPTGGIVGTLNIPSLEPGQEAIVEFEWMPPNPIDYVFVNNEPWHFCLLARIETPTDPMNFTEGTFITDNVKNNNNIAWKNMTVVNATQTGTPTIKPGGLVMIGNTTGENTEQYSFELFADEINSPVFDEAEVLITLNQSGFDRWLNGGGMAENIEIFNEEERELLITGNNAQLQNMLYEAGEWDTLYLSFNFLTDEVTGKSSFEYHLIQKNAEGEAVGGEVYQIVRDPERPHFDADGDSYENADDETVLLASDIGEPAIYNWYTLEGKLLHSGKEFVFIPEMPGDYLLEVIAEADGHKDYFKLTLSVNAAQDQIVSLSPNPATNTVTVQYQINNNASSASLNIASFFGSISNNYPIDLTNTNLNVNLEGYPPGHYAVILSIDGQDVHAKQLVIN